MSFTRMSHLTLPASFWLNIIVNIKLSKKNVFLFRMSLYSECKLAQI